MLLINRTVSYTFAKNKNLNTVQWQLILKANAADYLSVE